VGCLVLATGVRDVYPEIEASFDFRGSSVSICQHCDGSGLLDRWDAYICTPGNLTHGTHCAFCLLRGQVAVDVLQMMDHCF